MCVCVFASHEQNTLITQENDMKIFRSEVPRQFFFPPQFQPNKSPTQSEATQMA
jgi:hypothetical protein